MSQALNPRSKDHSPYFMDQKKLSLVFNCGQNILDNCLHMQTAVQMLCVDWTGIWSLVCEDSCKGKSIIHQEVASHIFFRMMTLNSYLATIFIKTIKLIH